MRSELLPPNQTRRRVHFVVLEILCAVASTIAQPPAPIQWGEARWLGLDSLEGAFMFRQQVVPLGDTLIFAAFASEPHRGAYVSTSYDNGMTHSEWQRTAPNDTITDSNLSIRGSESVVLVLREFYDNPASWRTYLSTDDGITWQQALTGNDERPSAFVSGNKIFITYSVATWPFPLHFKVRRSFDGGLTWLPAQVVDTTDLPAAAGHYLACTQSCLLVASGHQGVYDGHLFVARGEGQGENWTPFTEIPSQPEQTLNQYAIVADTSSELTMLLSTNTVSAFPLAPSDVWLYKSEDAGATWDSPIRMNDSSQAHVVFYPCLFTNGKLWGMAWAGRQISTQEYKFWWRFSANHGRNWYPEQVITSQTWRVQYAFGQFVNDETRIYWQAIKDTATGWPDLRTASGTITPDVLPPIVQPVDLPPDTVPISADLLFLAGITDDHDSLTRTSLRILSNNDTLTISMEWTEADYMASWTVPQEGRYWYRIEGEDWWENVGSYPDSGWAMLVTPGWIDDVADFTPHPMSFSLSVYPNPFNPTTTITFSLPRTQNSKLIVYDITGREVATLADGTYSVGEHHAIFDGAGKASGIYFAKLSTDSYQRTQKLLLLR